MYVYDQANNLAKSIKESKEYLEYKKAKEDLKSNPEMKEKINEFEKSLTDWGAVVIKFFLTVTPDEQLKRFKEREKNPLKRHKITDEDWRNRGKRSEYEQAVYDMLKYTSTDYAKWNVIDGNDKLSARLNIISNIIRVLENKLPTK